MLSLPLYNEKAKEIGKVELEKELFNGNINEELLHQVMVMYGNNKRLGCASTKTRKEVTGGGAKPWKQKGTGRARAGSIRSPLWRGGGIIFGPKPRDYSYSLSKTMRKGALLSALNSKLNMDGVVIVEKLTVDQPKTKNVALILSKLGAGPKPLIVLDKLNLNLVRACQNLPGTSVRVSTDLNAYDVMRHGKLIIVTEALNALTKELSK